MSMKEQRDKRVKSMMSKKRPFARDSDLQIHTQALSLPGNNKSFKMLHRQYASTVSKSDALKVAMDEATNAFESMREIQNQLTQAFSNLTQSRSKESTKPKS